LLLSITRIDPLWNPLTAGETGVSCSSTAESVEGNAASLSGGETTSLVEEDGTGMIG
jgi:hypothetical protein